MNVSIPYAQHSTKAQINIYGLGLLLNGNLSDPPKIGTNNQTG